MKNNCKILRASQFSIGVISDDLTGCGDVGSYFVKENFKTVIHLPSSPQGVLRTNFHLPTSIFRQSCDVLIIDTESRADKPSIAYKKVRSVARFFKRKNVKFIYKKVDSTLRGNIGSEIDALFDELKIQKLPFIPANPQQGRITKDGFHYVNGKFVSETEFGRDPKNPADRSPINDSYIPELLKRTCKNHSKVLLYNCGNMSELKEIAREVKGFSVVCGASGLLEELIKFKVKVKC